MYYWGVLIGIVAGVFAGNPAWWPSPLWWKLLAFITVTIMFAVGDLVVRPIFLRWVRRHGKAG